MRQGDTAARGVRTGDAGITSGQGRRREEQTSFILSAQVSAGSGSARAARVFPQLEAAASSPACMVDLTPWEAGGIGSMVEKTTYPKHAR